jgi:hypothetical protein
VHQYLTIKPRLHEHGLVTGAYALQGIVRPLCHFSSLQLLVFERFHSSLSVHSSIPRISVFTIDIIHKVKKQAVCLHYGNQCNKISGWNFHSSQYTALKESIQALHTSWYCIKYLNCPRLCRGMRIYFLYIICFISGSVLPLLSSSITLRNSANQKESLNLPALYSLRFISVIAPISALHFHWTGFTIRPLNHLQQYPRHHSLAPGKSSPAHLPSIQIHDWKLLVNSVRADARSIFVVRSFSCVYQSYILITYWL